MSVFILFLVLWLNTGQVIYTYQSFDDEDSREGAKPVMLANARAKFDAVGNDARCVRFDSIRSSQAGTE